MELSNCLVMQLLTRSCAKIVWGPRGYVSSTISALFNQSDALRSSGKLELQRVVDLQMKEPSANRFAIDK